MSVEPDVIDTVVRVVRGYLDQKGEILLGRDGDEISRLCEAPLRKWATAIVDGTNGPIDESDVKAASDRRDAIGDEFRRLTRSANLADVRRLVLDLLVASGEAYVQTYGVRNGPRFTNEKQRKIDEINAEIARRQGVRIW